MDNQDLDDNRYKTMICEKCSGSEFVFTLLQNDIMSEKERVKMVTVSARCICGKEMKLYDLCVGMER